MVRTMIKALTAGFDAGLFVNVLFDRIDGDACRHVSETPTVSVQRSDVDGDGTL